MLNRTKEDRKWQDMSTKSSLNIENRYMATILFKWTKLNNTSDEQRQNTKNEHDGPHQNGDKG